MYTKTIVSFIHIFLNIFVLIFPFYTNDALFLIFILIILVGTIASWELFDGCILNEYEEDSGVKFPNGRSAPIEYVKLSKYVHVAPQKLHYINVIGFLTVSIYIIFKLYGNICIDNM